MLGTFLLHSDDLGETEEILSANFAKIRIDAGTSGDSTKARVWRRSLGSFAVDEAEYGYDMSFDMEPPDHLLLCRVRSGALEDWRDGTTFGPGDMVAFGAIHGVLCSGAVRHARYDLIAVDKRLFGEVAGDQSVRFTSSAPANGDANRLLVDAIDYVRHGVLANPLAAQDTLIAGALSRYLAASVLSALPHTSGQVRGVGRREKSLVRLRRATAFIEEHADTDMSLGLIATATDSTTNSLRYLFRRYRDCTPMEYVWRVRLDRAHHDLVSGLGGAEGASGIAHRWGFFNLSDFAAAYRTAYGHFPPRFQHDEDSNTTTL